MSEPMFEEKPKLIEVLETPTVIETPAKVKKPRKPMSEERKEALSEQLKVAREIKKKKKEDSKPKEPEIKLEVGGHSVPEPVKKTLIKRKPRQKKEIERNIEPKIDDSIELRRQLDELRASHKSNENELLKQQITNQKLKNTKIKEKKEKKEKELEPIVESPPPSPIPPQKRYSTYKKSVWAEYGV